MAPNSQWILKCQLGDTRTLMVSTQPCTDGVSVLCVSTSPSTPQEAKRKMQRCPRARHAPSEIASFLVGVGQALASFSSEYTLSNKSHCPSVSSRGPFEKDVFRISKGVWMEGSLCPKAISLDRESEQTNTPYSLILKPWELQECQLSFFCVLCVQQLCCWPLSF